MSNFDKKVFRVFAEEKVTKVYYQDVIASSTEEVIKIIDGQKDGLAWIEDNEHPEAGAGDFKVFEEQANPIKDEELEDSLKYDEYDELYQDWWEDKYQGFDKDKWQEPIGGLR
jgi:hypothetical protein